MRKIYSLLIILMLSPFCQSPLLAQSSSVVWATQIAGQTTNESNTIATDRSGNIYTAGFYTDTTDFDPGVGAYNLIAHGQSTDIYIQKLDRAGHLIWARSMGGPGDDIVYSLAIDQGGNVFATGFFSDSADFDPGVNTSMLYSHGHSDIFVVKLDSSGNLIWAKGIGSNDYDFGQNLTLDAQGSVYLTGGFSDTMDLDPGVGVSNVIAAGNYDIFIEKLDKDGNYQWGMSAGSVEDNEKGMSMAADAENNLYVTGYFMDAVDFDPGPLVHSLASHGQEDIFILKLDSSGHFGWVRGYGGTNSDHGISLAQDGMGHVYVTANFTDTVTFGSDTLITLGANDFVVLKLDTAGDLIWVKQFGGLASDGGTFITTDASGNVYTAGVYSDTVDFDPGPGVYQLVSEAGSSYNSFVLKLDSAGAFKWAGNVTCTNISSVNSMALDAAGYIYLSGRFLGTTDIDPGIGTSYLTTSSIYTNSFTAKWNQLSTGITEKAFSDPIKAYPNPTKGNILIDMGQYFPHIEIEVMSLSGQKQSIGQYEHVKRVNLNLALLPGMYFIKVTTGDQRSMVTKVIVD